MSFLTNAFWYIVCCTEKASLAPTTRSKPHLLHLCPHEELTLFNVLQIFFANIHLSPVNILWATATSAALCYWNAILSYCLVCVHVAERQQQY